MSLDSGSQQTLPPDDTPLIPTTDKIAQECPKFRILVIGRSGTGKSSLINAIFKASIADVQNDKAGNADIHKEITSEHNEHFILHDSLGYEPGDNDKFDILKTFIVERSQKKLVADKLHAIWLCISVPHASSRFLETGDENIFELFQLKENKVPIIVVFTKFDLMVVNAKVSLIKNGVAKEQIPQKSEELAKKTFENEYGKSFKTNYRKVIDERYVVVSTYRSESLQHLVDITMKNIHVETSLNPLVKFGFKNPLVKFGFKNFFNTSPRTIPSTTVDENLSDSAHISLATAQRVDTDMKITASIRVGEKKYWVAIASGAVFKGRNLTTCLNAIHKDIVTVWNVRGLDLFLSSDRFHALIAAIVRDLSDNNKSTGPLSKALATAGTAVGIVSGIIASVTAGPAAAIVAPVVAAVLLAAWGYNIYQQTPGIICCLIGYVVDLTLILQVVFQVSLQNEEGKVEEDQVMAIVDRFDQSSKKKEIHDEIKGFIDRHYPFTKISVVGKIESLITANRDFIVESGSSTTLTAARHVGNTTLPSTSGS